MDRSGHRAGDLRSRYDDRRHGPSWLYDPVREEFLPDPEYLAQKSPALHYRLSGFDSPFMTRTCAGRLLFWLFVKGGMAVVLILGLMVVAVVGGLLGFR